jgi:hypothetical protein
MVAEAQRVPETVCVQNHYNPVHREDDALVDELASKGIAYVPFFPLGRLRPNLFRRMQLRRGPGRLEIPGSSGKVFLKYYRRPRRAQSTADNRVENQSLFSRSSRRCGVHRRRWSWALGGRHVPIRRIAFRLQQPCYDGYWPRERGGRASGDDGHRALISH